MWHWLRKKVRGIDFVARVSVVLAVGIHLFLLLLMVCVEWVKPVQQIQINRQLQDVSTAIIIIDPTVKETKVIQSFTGVKQQAGIPSTTQKQATSAPRAASTVIKEQKAKKQPPAQSKTKPKAKPTAQKKPAQKKAEEKKTIPKKEPAKPKLVEAPKKEPEKKVAPVEKKFEPKPTAPQVQAAQDIAQVNNASALPDSNSGPMIIARSARDAALLAVHLAIQDELLRVWHPPVGIDESVACTVRVNIDAEGTIQSLELTQPSGILLFDISARAAIQQAVWPRAVWGNTLELCLQ